MKFAARLLGFLFAFLILFFVSKATFAQTTNTPNNNLHNYSQNVLIELMSAMGCQLTGIDPVNRQQPCLGVDYLTGKVGFSNQSNHGLTGFMTGMISQLYTPPIHTGDYVRYLAGNFGIAKGTYAQQVGIGLRSIGPIATLWVAFRNIVYFLFILIFVVIGVAIMLRVKIDPRTVMTLQNQLPKIIIGLILVTLSFPIAGLLIDLMWVLIAMITNIFIGINNTILPDPIRANTFISPFGLAELAGGALGVARDAAFVVGNSIFQSGFDATSVNSTLGLAAKDCGFLGIGCWIDTLIATILSVIVGLIAFIVIAVAIVVSLFRLWFALLKAYISIILDIIFAPFWILAGLIPGAGEKVSFGAWARDMLGNLMAFPAVITIFLLAAVFIKQFGNSAQAGNATDVSKMFIPPLIGSPDPSRLGAIIAMGLILFSPEVVKMTKAAFKAPQGGIGGNIGKGISVGAGIISMPVKRVGGSLFGKNAYGVPHVGSQWVGDFVGRRFGSRPGKLAQFAAGGGTKLKSESAKEAADQRAEQEESMARAVAQGVGNKPPTP